MSFAQRLLFALSAWEVCVVGSLLALLASQRSHIWDKGDFVWFGGLATCGLLVVGAVALSSRRLGKIGGAITGLLWGLVPSIVIFTWVLVARPGFEASAGGAGVAMLLAVPSGVGGAFAGIICSRRKESSMPSIISG